MDVLGWIACALAPLAAMLAPGLLIERALGLRMAGLARGVVAIALGRVAFSALALGGVGLGGPKATALGVPLLVGAASMAAAGLVLRGRRRGPGAPLPAEVSQRIGGPELTALLAAGLLVVSVVGRSGLADATGDLVFFGRDASNDPLVYGAMTLRAAQTGLPLTNPFASGVPVTSSYGPYGIWVGLLALGVPLLDAVLRVTPLFDAAVLGLAAVALLRALGAPRGAQAAGALLLLLGGSAGSALPWLAALAGRTLAPADGFALFGPYLLAFNPIAAALHLLLAAWLLLAAGGRRRAAVAGALVALLFEWKLFLWLPALGALLATAAVRPPRRARGDLRIAAGVATLTSLPFLADKALFALRVPEHETSFGLCLGCVPRHLARVAFGGAGDLRSFRGALGDQLASPSLWATAVGAALAIAALGLGARWLALPTLLRGARGEAGPAAVQRLVLWGSLLGWLGLCAARVEPHPLNAAQLAWLASFALWPFAAWTVVAARGARRVLSAVALVGLTLPGTIDTLGRLGWSAPVHLRVSAEERRMMDAVAAASAAGDVVVEPSMLLDTDRPASVTFLAGRPAYLTLLSAVQSLAPEERLRRGERIAAVFGAEGARLDPRAALRHTGARFVLVPRGMAPAEALRPVLAPRVRDAWGTLYGVEPPGAPGVPPADVDAAGR